VVCGFDYRTEATTRHMPQPQPITATLPFDESFDDIIDVRSESEFAEDRLPGSINLPLLNDSQRVEVGTDYKQVGGFEAKRSGAVLIMANISRHLAEHFADKPKSYRPLIYCWRGGQRSQSLAVVLAAIGWRTHILDGGYKTYRRHILDQLEILPAQFRWIAINGLTGSAKTRVLHHLAEQGEQILDLEGLANHKGSVLGLDPDNPQPSQKLFESRIHHALAGMDASRPVFVEAESKKVGNVHCPEAVWKAMTGSTVFRIEAERMARVQFLLEDYGHFLKNPDLLQERIHLLRERYGQAQIEHWEAQIAGADWPAFVDSILEVHYDPSYKSSVRYPKATEVFTTDTLDADGQSALARNMARAVTEL